MDHTKISIIIPAYNEEQGIGEIVSRVIDLYSEAEIIVVDDGSTDDTAKDCSSCRCDCVQPSL